MRGRRHHRRNRSAGEADTRASKAGFWYNGDRHRTKKLVAKGRLGTGGSRRFHSAIITGAFVLIIRTGDFHGCRACLKERELCIVIRKSKSLLSAGARK